MCSHPTHCQHESEVCSALSALAHHALVSCLGVARRRHVIISALLCVVALHAFTLVFFSTVVRCAARTSCTGQASAWWVVRWAAHCENERFSSMAASLSESHAHHARAATCSPTQACANGNIECVSALLEAGARVVGNDAGNTPLHWAVLNRHIDVRRALQADITHAVVRHDESSTRILDTSTRPRTNFAKSLQSAFPTHPHHIVHTHLRALLPPQPR